MDNQEPTAIDVLEAGMDASLFGASTPANIIDILKVMKKEEDIKMSTLGAAKAVYNPTWRVLAEHIRGQQSRIDSLLVPLEFEYKAGRPLLVVKLGSDSKGWIPHAKHFDAVRKVLKAAGEDLSKNILLFHYGLQIETYDRS